MNNLSFIEIEMEIVLVFLIRFQVICVFCFFEPSFFNINNTKEGKNT